jgi:hypothetical protein
MNAETITSVLGWSMVINLTIFFVWVIAMKLMPNLTYKTQSLVTSITREEFDLVMYKMMGQYKILMLVTHVGPYVALRIVLGS